MSLYYREYIVHSNHNTSELMVFVRAVRINLQVSVHHVCLFLLVLFKVFCGLLGLFASCDLCLNFTYRYLCFHFPSVPSTPSYLPAQHYFFPASLATPTPTCLRCVISPGVSCSLSAQLYMLSLLPAPFH